MLRNSMSIFIKKSLYTHIKFWPFCSPKPLADLVVAVGTMHSHQILLKGRIFSYFPSNFRDQISPSNCMGCIRHTHATNLHLKCYEKTSRSEGCNTYSCDPAKCSWLYMPFIAATKHLYECFNPSVRPSYVIVRKREKNYLTLWPFLNLWPWLVAGPGLMSCSTVTENSTAIVTMWRKMFCYRYTVTEIWWIRVLSLKCDVGYPWRKTLNGNQRHILRPLKAEPVHKFLEIRMKTILYWFLFYINFHSPDIRISFPTQVTHAVMNKISSKWLISSLLPVHSVTQYSGFMM